MPDRDFRHFDPAAIHVAPSLLAADFACLGDQIAAVAEAGADVLHIDVMDGHFVPNLSMGPGVVESIRPHSGLLFDVHLMLTHPARYVEPFVKAGADHITFHVESESDTAGTIDLIHRLGCTAGLSLKPGTPVDALYPWLDRIEMVLVMSVEPGFGGQSFMADQMPKLQALRHRAVEHGSGPLLEVDGGVNRDTARVCIEAGATVIVAGTSVFRAAEGMEAAIDAIRGASPVT